MKKFTLLLILTFIIQTGALSQSCLPDGIIFTTQSAVDNFQTNYPDCTEIEGSVDILGDDIMNLSGLSVVTSIGGVLEINFNPALTSLTGLENLTCIGGSLRVYHNPALTSLTGLENLDSIGGNLKIQYNDTLTSLTGLENLTSIGGNIYIEYNDALTSLTGLENLDSIGGYLRIEHNYALTSLTGLENLASMEEHIIIRYNYALISLTDLENLDSIGGHLRIEHNYALTSLTGLENLITIGGALEINYNPALTSLTGLENITSTGGGLSIRGNNALTSLTGLENITTIGGDLSISGNGSLTSIAVLKNITSIGKFLWIESNHALTSLTGLENLITIGGDLHIEYNDTLTSLTGLENIDAGSIMNLSIRNNNFLSTCEAQSICNYLANPSGIVEVYNNATGCNNPPEIANACGTTLACLPFGNYYFFTQLQIDNFVTNYLNCTILEGDVLISGDDITNLNGLNVVTSIGGNLSVGDYWGGISTLLTSLTGLENLDSIGGNFRILYNDSLASLTGLENLTSIGGVLDIYGNVSLASLTGLENLTSIGGVLRIDGNNVLTSLTGLDNINANSIFDLSIFGNSSLSTCEVQSICNYLTNPNGSIGIGYNATGCNSQQEVEEACALVLVDEINSNGHFLIYPNPVKDYITISCKYEAPLKKIIIYNQLGQTVYEAEVLNSTINVSNLQSGMYIIEIVTSEFKIREKLIKR